MSFPDTLSKFLEDHHVHFNLIHHQVVYTAQEVAQISHLPGQDVAKTIVFFADGNPMLAVLPANHKINIASLKESLQAENVRLAHEEEMEKLFPEIEVGAIPPLGLSFDIPVIVSEALAHDENITFNAGTHTEAVTIPYKEFESLVNPVVADFSEVYYGKFM